jgi:hypothetical protein
VTRVHLTEGSARRIASAVRIVEQSGRGAPAVTFRQPSDDGDPVRLGKTTAAWNKGTTATIELYEEGTPPSEGKKTPAETLEDCVNKFANVGSGKWVIVAKAANGSWYLISAEC